MHENLQKYTKEELLEQLKSASDQKKESIYLWLSDPDYTDDLDFSKTMLEKALEYAKENNKEDFTA